MVKGGVISFSQICSRPRSDLSERRQVFRARWTVILMTTTLPVVHALYMTCVYIYIYIYVHGRPCWANLAPNSFRVLKFQGPGMDMARASQPPGPFPQQQHAANKNKRKGYLLLCCVCMGQGEGVGYHAKRLGATLFPSNTVASHTPAPAADGGGGGLAIRRRSELDAPSRFLQPVNWLNSHGRRNQGVDLSWNLACVLACSLACLLQHCSWRSLFLVCATVRRSVPVFESSLSKGNLLPILRI
jgi:hypothetical protein